MTNEKRFRLKTKFEEQQQLANIRQNQRYRRQADVKVNSFGFYDVLFITIIIVVSLMCKLMGFSFQ